MPVLTVYKCSRCDYMSSLTGMLKRHVETSKGCRGCDVMVKEFDLAFGAPPPEDHLPTPVARVKPGPKVPDMSEVLRGRVKYDDIDSRKEYAGNELAETFFAVRRPLPQFVGTLFSKLWGRDAPTEFKSIVVRDPRVYYVLDSDEDSTTVDSEKYSKKFARHLAKIVLAVAEDFCDEFIDQYPAADVTLHLIRKTSRAGVNLENVLDRDASFTDNRRHLEEMLKLADDITEAVANALNLCAL